MGRELGFGALSDPEGWMARLDAPVFSYLRLADGHLTALDCCELELDCALVTLSAPPGPMVR